MTDVQIDITPIVSNIVDDIIDEVVKSKTTMPSIPAVLLETIDTVIEEQQMEEENEDIKGEASKGSGSVIGASEVLSDVVREDKRKEEIPARQSSVSELVNNLEKIHEAKEMENVENRSTSPRRGGGSISPVDSPTEKKEVNLEEGGNTEEAKVSVTSVVKTDSFKKATKQEEKRGLEVQSVKVKISDDDEGPIASSDIDDIITINGQPVPAASTVVLNGHITKMKDLPQTDTQWSRQRSESPHSTGSRGSRGSRGSSQTRGFVPQTDLDTFETKITNSNEPLDISNPDDDSSDQRSDTGSINTVDSVDKEEVKPSPAHTRKAHIRQKNDKVNKFLMFYICPIE